MPDQNPCVFVELLHILPFPTLSPNAIRHDANKKLYGFYYLRFFETKNRRHASQHVQSECRKNEVCWLHRTVVLLLFTHSHCTQISHVHTASARTLACCLSLTMDSCTSLSTSICWIDSGSVCACDALSCVGAKLNHWTCG